MDDRFPPPFRYQSELLLREIGKLPDYDTAPPFQLSEEYWKFLIDKIKAGSALSDAEKILAINNANQLSADLCRKLETLFAANATEDLLTRASRLLNRTLKPANAVSILLATSITQRFGAGHLSSGLVKHAWALSQDNHETLFKQLLQNETDLRGVLDSFSTQPGADLSPGQLWILRTWITSDASRYLLEHAYEHFWSWLSSVQPERKLALAQADRAVEHYLKSHPNWNTQVLEPTSVAGRLVNDIRKIQQETGLSIEPYKSLYRVIQEFLNLQSALKDLSALVPQRGEFWKNQLPRASRVITRSFRSGTARVAVAMEFGNKVVVEFGPVGNAAHIYAADTFFNQVQSTPSWREKDLTTTVAEFPDGRIIHNEGWTRKAQSFLRRELGRG